MSLAGVDWFSAALTVKLNNPMLVVFPVIARARVSVAETRRQVPTRWTKRGSHAPVAWIVWLSVLCASHRGSGVVPGETGSAPRSRAVEYRCLRGEMGVND